VVINSIGKAIVAKQILPRCVCGTFKIEKDSRWNSNDGCFVCKIHDQCSPRHTCKEIVQPVAVVETVAVVLVERCKHVFVEFRLAFSKPWLAIRAKQRMLIAILFPLIWRRRKTHEPSRRIGLNRPIDECRCDVTSLDCLV